MANEIRPGIYSIDYFSGAQVGVFIGDVLIDEVTSISYEIFQNRKPLYGYADTLFRAVSKGQVLVQGQFTINFKEAGYLWLVLNHYKEMIKGSPGLLATPFNNSQSIEDLNIEKLINGEPKTADRMKALAAISEQVAKELKDPDPGLVRARKEQLAFGSLGGFASSGRAAGGVGQAESMFEMFEDKIWKSDRFSLDEDDRRADDPDLNPFDIYLSYGDFAGDNRINHTIRKLSNVHILGSGQQIVIDGQPIQESYSFIAQNIV